MKTLKILTLIMVIFIGRSFSQEGAPLEMREALKADDAIALGKLITKKNVNTCYGNYSILSLAIKAEARKCFDLILSKGADVNNRCNNYKPPFQLAAKYSSLEMVKILVAKGADTKYRYGGQTMAEYAKSYGREDVAAYLSTLKQ